MFFLVNSFFSCLGGFLFSVKFWFWRKFFENCEIWSYLKLSERASLCSESDPEFSCSAAMLFEFIRVGGFSSKNMGLNRVGKGTNLENPSAYQNLKKWDIIISVL